MSFVDSDSMSFNTIYFVLKNQDESLTRTVAF